MPRKEPKKQPSAARVESRLEGAEEQSASQRHNFGDTGSAWIEVEISADGQEAHLKELSFGGDPSLAAAQVHKALAELFLIHTGLNRQAIDQIAERAARSRGSVVRGNFLIARGHPPMPGEDGRTEYPFLEGSGRRSPPGAEILQAFEQTELEAVLAAEPAAHLAAPGQVLAALASPTKGEPGKDIFGTLRTRPGEEARLQSGDHVKRAGAHFVAEIYGYVCVVDDEISMLPPLWISPERTEAYFIHFPQADTAPAPQPQWMMQALQSRGIQHGIQEERIEELCRRPPAADEKRAFLLAQATPPVPGVDTHIRYTFDPEKKSGKILEDGGIDLRERNAAISVEADQLLGELVPATPGEPGRDLMDEEIATREGQERSFTAGDKVRVDSGGGATRYYAEIAGHAQIKGGTLQVNPVFYVNGDLDYELGNIDVAGDVQIGGAVRSGFSIRAGGSIAVGETVEADVSLHARGDLIVAQGIFGSNTQVVILGDVQAKFIQDCAVTAHGDIIAGSYIFNARVHAGGRIEVQAGGGERGGSIVGGEVFATHSIEARRLGSPSTDRTLVGIGPAPEVGARLGKLGRVIEHCEAHILRILRTLGLQRANTERIKALIQAAPPSKKASIIALVKKMQNLMDTREKSIKEKENLELQAFKDLQHTWIKATERAFGGVQIRMGNNSKTLSQDLEPTLFYPTLEGVHWRSLEHGDQEMKE